MNINSNNSNKALELNSSKINSTKSSKSVKRKKVKSKTKNKKNKSEKNLLQETKKIIIEPTIVNEPSILKPRIILDIKKNKKPQPTLKILYIYRKEKNETTILQNSTLGQIKEILCEKLHLFPDKCEIYYKNTLIPNQNYNDYIMTYIKKYGGIYYFQIRKKLTINSEKLIQKSYNYKVKVTGINNIKNFYNHIKLFFQDTYFNPDFICEPIGDKIYTVGFPVADLAFDFHRYLLILKISTETYKDIVTSYQIEKNNLEQNIHIYNDGFKLKNNKKKNNNLLSTQLKGPYKPYDELNNFNYDLYTSY